MTALVTQNLVVWQNFGKKVLVADSGRKKQNN